VFQSKDVEWEIEDPANFANQMAYVVGVVEDPLVTFPSLNVRKDLASRLDRAHGHGRLHHESIVNSHDDIIGPIIFGKAGHFCSLKASQLECSFSLPTISSHFMLSSMKNLITYLWSTSMTNDIFWNDPGNLYEHPPSRTRPILRLCRLHRAI
jgi:hypothetical protein